MEGGVILIMTSFEQNSKKTWANIEKAERILGWRPRVNIDEGLKKTVDWYLENKSWLRDISLEENIQNI